MTKLQKEFNKKTIDMIYLLVLYKIKYKFIKIKILKKNRTIYKKSLIFLLIFNYLKIFKLFFIFNLIIIEIFKNIYLN